MKDKETVVEIGETPLELVVTTQKPLTQEAWDWFQDKASLGAGIRPSNYLTFRDCEAVSEALGRRLTLEEIRTMVVPDEGPTECAICHKSFQPVRYLAVTARLLEALKNLSFVKVVAAESGVWRGSFFWPPGREMFGVCGSPFKFDSRAQKSFHPPNSHLVMAFRENVFSEGGGTPFPHWGRPRKETEKNGRAREERFKALCEEKEAMNRAASALFARSGGGGFRNGPQWMGGNNDGSHGYPGKEGMTARREKKHLREAQKEAFQRNGDV